MPVFVDLIQSTPVHKRSNNALHTTVYIVFFHIVEMIIVYIYIFSFKILFKEIIDFVASFDVSKMDDSFLLTKVSSNKYVICLIATNTEVVLIEM